jgi:hypothetical protein
LRSRIELVEAVINDLLYPLSVILTKVEEEAWPFVGDV